MLNDLLLGLGLTAVIEGLVLALAPSRLGEMLELIKRTPVERLRVLGLLAVAFGVGLIWLARH